MQSKNWLVKTGDFFFKYRNLLFPTLLLMIFLIKPPAYSYLKKEWLEELKDVLAIFIIFSGLSLRAAVIGYKYIKRGGLNKKVYAENLVTDGFFGVCRNPLYVGNFMIYAGILLMHGHLLVIALGGTFFVFVYTAIVAAEEYFLKDKFGAAFDAYCSDVPRWSIKWSGLKAATQGMSFNVKRVIAKDYTTIANAIIGICIIEMWEQIAESTSRAHVLHATILGVAIGITGAAVVTVRFLKKRGLLTT